MWEIKGVCEHKNRTPNSGTLRQAPPYHADGIVGAISDKYIALGIDGNGHRAVQASTDCRPAISGVLAAYDCGVKSGSSRGPAIRGEVTEAVRGVISRYRGNDACDGIDLPKRSADEVWKQGKRGLSVETRKRPCVY